MDDIVELVEHVRQDMATNASSEILSHAEECGMDTSLPFFDHLISVFDGLNSPLASVRTTHRQHTFISKNLQYIVSQSLHKSVCFINYVSLITKEPIWYEVGTHIGFSQHSKTPTNVPDGFYYVPFLQTLQALLKNSSIFSQVILVTQFCN
jgi:hypothetical protein